MEVTIVTRLSAEGNMNVYTGHFGAKLQKLMQRNWIILFLLLSLGGYAQRNATIFTDEAKEYFEFSDTLQLVNYLEKAQMDLLNAGYFFAGIDSIQKEADQKLNIYLHKGEKYKSKGAGRKDLLAEAQSKLDFLANHGYPFAAANLDSLTIEDNEVLIGRVNIAKGPEIRLDTLVLANQISTNRGYLHNLLELEPATLFSEVDYQRIDERIKRSPFLVLNRPQDVAFQDGKAAVFLDLTQTKSSEFEGIIGLQQNNTGGSTAVGSLRLDANNLFNGGHQLNFLWERFSPESQDLNLFYKHAFLFESSISPSFHFALLRQDTSFLIRTSGIGINMFVFSNLQLSASFESMRATLISDEIEALQGRSLADYRRNLYRLELQQGHILALREFKNASIWNFSIGVGNKQIDQNVGLPASYYDSIRLNTEFLEVKGMLAYQIKARKRVALFHQLNIGALYNEELLTNERYRLGGLSTVRGFNEKEFFADRYFSSRMEIRSFFENQSFFYLFYDQLLYTRNGINDAPFGLGLGFALETLSGQFNFALASGESNQQSLSFEELRVHFGYTANF